jgi:hypothetical protein
VKYLYIISLLFLFAPRIASAQVESDLEALDLKGKVKTVRIERAKFTSENGQFKEDKPVPREQTTFDEKGYCTEKVGLTSNSSKKFAYRYSPDGKIWERTDLNSSEREIFTYQKNRIERITQHKDGRILDRWIYNLDDNGNKVKDEYILVDKSSGQRLLNPIDVTTYKYDAQRRLIETEYFKADGSPTIGLIFSSHKYVNVYDDKNRIIERSAYNLDNTLVSKWIYKYNEKGYLEEISQFGPNLALLEKRTYSDFDAAGNWTKSKTFKIRATGGRTTIEPAEAEYRTLTYYP